MRPRQGRAPSRGPGLSGAGRAGNLLCRPTCLLAAPPAASLVLLNQQSQDLGLGQGHVGIHAEVVGAAMVLPAEVPAGGEMQGQWGQGSVPASPPGSQSYPAAARSTFAHIGITRYRLRVLGEVGPAVAWVGPPVVQVGPAVSKVPPDSKTQTLMQIPDSQDEGPELTPGMEGPENPVPGKHDPHTGPHTAQGQG